MNRRASKKLRGKALDTIVEIKKKNFGKSSGRTSTDYYKSYKQEYKEIIRFRGEPKYQTSRRQLRLKIAAEIEASKTKEVEVVETPTIIAYRRKQKPHRIALAKLLIA